MIYLIQKLRFKDLFHRQIHDQTLPRLIQLHRIRERSF